MTVPRSDTSPPPADCLDRAAAEQLVADALPEREAVPLWEHASACASCRELIAAVESPDELLRALRQVRTVTTARESTGPSAAPARPGTIAGYEIGEELSRGGQGVVFRAFQQATRREVALKVLRGGELASVGMRRRFQREIELASQLSHPNLITVFDSGTTADGLPFYVMDFVAGRPLDEHVRRAQLDVRAVVDLLARIADAVAYAHQHGVIHRDLKPSNILVDERGEPRILDFGLARDVNAAAHDPTVTGQVLGTLPYMSPEQAAGERHAVTTLTDVYALGVILYRLLVGQFPYPVDGTPLEIVRHIVSSEPTSLAKRWSPDTGIPLRYARRIEPRCPIDGELETIVLKALEKEPERRYAGASALAADLRRYLAGDPIVARPASAWYVTRKLISRHRFPAIVLTLLLIAVGGFGTFAAQSLWTAAVARRDVARTTDALVATQRERDQLAQAELLPLVRRQSLGWLLLNWQAAGTAGRGTFVENFAPGTAERAFAEYLFASDADVDSLRAALPSADAYLADLAIAERHRAAGALSEAQAAYATVASTARDPWTKRYAAERASALAAYTEASGPATNSSGAAPP
jgi:serine/threonine protein kinase